MKKYKSVVRCNICNAELSSGWCKTRIGVWLKLRKLKKGHKHSALVTLIHDSCEARKR